ILSSSKRGDVVLDPFFGTGTTGAVAKKLGRHYIGIERDDTYIKAATERLAQVEELEKHLVETPAKREQPRIPFGTLVEKGLLKPGAVLRDAKDTIKVTVHADGSVMAQNRVDRVRGSIHKVGATLQGAPSCNGWTYWHYEDEGKFRPIDDLRQQIIQETMTGTA
ncbi:MAG: site-specific DNA-methyltransferase, partial [Alphaproteobacteria bacterium]|nr:site-specific DNA-methyltransferase [Alphaproteobacteria bacterium]